MLCLTFFGGLKEYFQKIRGAKVKVLKYCLHQNLSTRNYVEDIEYHQISTFSKGVNFSDQKCTRYQF